MAHSSDENLHTIDAAVQQIWATKDLSTKLGLFESMTATFKFRRNVSSLIASAKAVPSRIDKIAADLMQLAHGNRVVR